MEKGIFPCQFSFLYLYFHVHGFSVAWDNISNYRFDLIFFYSLLTNGPNVDSLWDVFLGLLGWDSLLLNLVGKVFVGQTGEGDNWRALCRFRSIFKYLSLFMVC